MRRHERRRVSQLCRRCCAQVGRRTITRLHRSLAQREPTRCPSAPQYGQTNTSGSSTRTSSSPTSTNGGSSTPTLLPSRSPGAKLTCGPGGEETGVSRGGGSSNAAWDETGSSGSENRRLSGSEVESRAGAAPSCSQASGSGGPKSGWSGGVTSGGAGGVTSVLASNVSGCSGSDARERRVNLRKMSPIPGMIHYGAIRRFPPAPIPRWPAGGQPVVSAAVPAPANRRR